MLFIIILKSGLNNGTLDIKRNNYFRKTAAFRYDCLMNNSTCLVFEFGAHYHVVPPLISVLDAKKNLIFIDKQFAVTMKETLYSYSINGKVGNIRNSCEVLRALLNLREKNIVVSTAREWILSKQEFWLILLIAIMRPKIVCIRNPIRWRFEGLKLLTKENSRLKIFLSVLALRFLAICAKNIIVESESQKEYTEKFLSTHKNIIPFPGRLIDVIPVRPPLISEIFTPEMYSQDIVIGILGTIDEEKRDYDTLLDTLRFLSKTYSFSVIFLGNTKPKSADKVIMNFSKFVNVITHPLGNRDEFSFYHTSKKCDFLISPLKLIKSYGSLNGTGTVADAIFTNRFLLLPKQIKFGESYKSFLIYYEIRELKKIIEDFVKNLPSATPVIEDQTKNWIKSMIR